MIVKPTRGTRTRSWRNLAEYNSTDWRNVMPLKKGTSQAVVSSNIKTLVNEWENEGSIGSSHPATKQKSGQAGRCDLVEKSREKPQHPASRTQKVTSGYSIYYRPQHSPMR